MRHVKDSGIEWIGKTPKDWSCVKAKNIFSQSTEKGNIVLELLSATQNNGVVPKTTLEGVVQVSEDADLTTFKTVHKGDYVISLRSFQGGFEMSNHEGVITPAYTVFRAKIPINKQYYKMLFKCDGFISKMNSLTVGIREGKNIMFKDFGDSCIPSPPLDDQQRIADFLECKCALIDSKIEKEKQVIEKLKAFMLSVISETVTQGLNSDVQMKDSGIDWLGEVPKSWQVRRLRYIGTCQNGISKSGDFFGSGYPFVSYGDVYKNIALPLSVDGLIKSNDNEQETYSVKEGDIFFTRTSETIEEIGLTAVCMKTIEKATFAGFLIRVRPFTNVLDKGYAKYYFRSNKHRLFFIKEMNLVTRASLSQELLKKLPVLIPPLEEQKLISDYLDKKCNQISKAIKQKQKLIEKLIDYKKSLLYEAVTGKLEI